MDPYIVEGYDWSKFVLPSNFSSEHVLRDKSDHPGQAGIQLKEAKDNPGERIQQIVPQKKNRPCWCWVCDWVASRKFSDFDSGEDGRRDIAANLKHSKFIQKEKTARKNGRQTSDGKQCE
ncbi:hypothetical protein Y032_0115g501 [Ancylostoma ceylanicum]|uniref:Uncharacterized protein n=1 Tax=Ancylostoma ceylanicum TaxID=53326 RepID=A0A016TCU6_9BILA|nr:hypothetical protein Y032_0115g501 [Ancylostoma ceylanicum]